MSDRIVADVPGKVYAFKRGALLTVVRGHETSPFGVAYEPVRRELVGWCTSFGFRGPNPAADTQPEWMNGAEKTILKVWDKCPAEEFEHDCALAVADATAG